MNRKQNITRNGMLINFHALPAIIKPAKLNADGSEKEPAEEIEPATEARTKRFESINKAKRASRELQNAGHLYTN